MSNASDIDTPALPRRSLVGTASLVGPGLFTGRQARLELSPAPAGTGIRFVRRDADGRDLAAVAARITHVEQRPRHTVLRGEGIVIETIEHLMAALAGAGVTDATVAVEAVDDPTVESVELPMGDGSSDVFAAAITEAGVERIDGPALRPIVVNQPVHVRGEGGASIVALPGPADALEVVYTFEAPPPINRQTFVGRFDWPGTGRDTFAREIQTSRTFIFEREAEALKAQGWGGHLTYRDLLVVGDDGPVDNAFRFDDEPVRHKVLDLIGDLALAGRPVCGRIVAHRSGHALNHDLVRALLEAETPARQATPPRRASPTEAAEFRDLLNRPASEAAIDIRAIQRILPHRFPMLLVDRVLQIDGDRRAVGVKNVTMGDVYFLGHYPRQPIFPGVLIVEAMGQLGGILLSRKLEHTGKIAILLGMNNVKLRQTVTPGDQLVLVAEAVRVKRRSGQVRCRAYVAEKLAAEAEIKFMLADAEAD